MLVNPPYVRYHYFPIDYRQQIQELAQEQTNIKISGGAGLYAYHLLIMDKWLSEEGIGIWLLPSIFLQSRYGEAIRQYLINNVQLIRLHVYDYNKQQFENAQATTAIVVFKKSTPDESHEIVFTDGVSVENPISRFVINRRILHEASDNWRKIFADSKDKRISINCDTDKITFEDMFDIKRGVATGANSFFVLERSIAKKIEIPDFALKPLLPKAKLLKSRIVNADSDGYPDIEKQLVLIDCELSEETIRAEYPLFFDYLLGAKKKEPNEKPIVECTLVSSRHPRYKQERREPYPFLLTYMGRGKKDSYASPLYFTLNKSEAVALNTYLLLYPRKWLLDLLNKSSFLFEAVLNALEKTANSSIISQQARIYSGGLKKT